MTQSLDVLINRLDEILAELDSAVVCHRREIDVVASGHRRGAVNLVRYAALRRHDVRDLQVDLTDVGATSLGAPEADVYAKVQAAREVLAALRRDPDAGELAVVGHDLEQGDEILTAHARSLFGAPRPGRPTRIMVTFPSEAADDPGLVTDFVRAGLDVARINCAHDGPAEWGRMVDNIRRAEMVTGRQVVVAMDVAGPKLRTGPIRCGASVGHARVRRDAEGHLRAPARLWLVPADWPDSPAAPVTAGEGRPALTIRIDPSWLKDCRAGDTVRLRDNRGLQRTFTVCQPVGGCVLLEGARSAYVANGTELECVGRLAIAEGIPPLVRRLSLAAGDRLILTSDLTPVELPAPGEIARIGCTLPEVIDALEPGQPVLFDDGAIEAIVEEVASGEATLTVTGTKPGGQRLGAEKGINVPETDVALPALTAQDQANLPFIATHGDLLEVSFVRSVGDVEQVLQALDGLGADQLRLVLKIETAQGFRALPSILLAAMRRPRLGVMIARGDLAVEVGFERLSEVAPQMLALCEAAHVPVIWATEVLETMAKTGHPSRAEITDAAAAQRSECVMLNKGPHILEAIGALDDILERMGEVQRKSPTLLRRLHSWNGS